MLPCARRICRFLAQAAPSASSSSGRSHPRSVVVGAFLADGAVQVMWAFVSAYLWEAVRRLKGDKSAAINIEIERGDRRLVGNIPIDTAAPLAQQAFATLEPIQPDRTVELRQRKRLDVPTLRGWSQHVVYARRANRAQLRPAVRRARGSGACCDASTPASVTRQRADHRRRCAPSALPERPFFGLLPCRWQRSGGRQPSFSRAIQPTIAGAHASRWRPGLSARRSGRWTRRRVGALRAGRPRPERRRASLSSVERHRDAAERSEVGHARVTRAGLEHIGRDARRDDVAATQS